MVGENELKNFDENLRTKKDTIGKSEQKQVTTDILCWCLQGHEFIGEWIISQIGGLRSTLDG